MKVIISLPVLILGVIALFQSASAIYPDFGYILGLIVMLVTLLGGFAKLVSQNSQLQSTVDFQAKAMIKQDEKIKEIIETMNKMEDKIENIEKEMIRREK